MFTENILYKNYNIYLKGKKILTKWSHFLKFLIKLQITNQVKSIFYLSTLHY
jgi:hypothetical protein